MVLQRIADNLFTISNFVFLPYSVILCLHEVSLQQGNVPFLISHDVPYTFILNELYTSYLLSGMARLS